MSAPSAARVVRRLTTRPCGFRFEDRLVRERVKSARLDATCVLSSGRTGTSPPLHPLRIGIRKFATKRTRPDRPATRGRAGSRSGAVHARISYPSLGFSPSGAGGTGRTPRPVCDRRDPLHGIINKSTGLVLESHVTAALRHAQRETATQGSAQTLSTTTSGLMRCDSWRRAGRTSRQACGVPPPSRARGS